MRDSVDNSETSASPVYDLPRPDTVDSTLKQALLTPHSEHRMKCMELWGGFKETSTMVSMTGLDGYVFSRPFDQEKDGGDVYYFTSCASGRISRVLLADVAGHGAEVSQTADQLRSIMRRHVNVIGQSSLVTALNTGFCEASEGGRFATALVITYFEPQRSLTISIAGHPPPLVFRTASGRWSKFDGFEGDTAATADLPLGISEDAVYQRKTIDFEIGDLLLAFTDAYFEAADADGKPLLTDGLLRIMNSSPNNSSENPVGWLQARLKELSPANLEGDDATAIVLRPTGSGIPMKNNLLAPVRMLRGVTEESVSS